MDIVPKTRVNREAETLRPFFEVTKEYPFPVFRGQGYLNCLPPEKVGFQFGDLRVETPSRTVLVEVESSGGVTNLVKYWYLIQQGFVPKPVVLMHLFEIKSPRDYESHLLLWDDLAAKMSTSLGSAFAPERHSFRDSGDLDVVLVRFRRLLAEDVVAE